MLNYFNSKMILTGTKIQNEVKKGKIIIEPFFESQINPNSYNML